MKKVILTTVLFISSFSALNAQDNKADGIAITNALNILQTGWNAKSGEKFSAAFADVHDYIVVNGLYFPAFTSKQNAAIHQQLFDGIYKNNNILLKKDKITFYSKDLAQLTAIGANYPVNEGVPRDPSAIMTLVLERKKDGWKIISFHNHELNVEVLKQRSPVPMEVMYASWYKN
ncbi:MAG TPA: SgcJ/EcaC family oxidoreductase [Segetibacter sp.]|jgi:uncharacterized protein (TIGR02246 family)